MAGGLGGFLEVEMIGYADISFGGATDREVSRRTPVACGMWINASSVS